jgi:S-layer protein (TIGR01567 family)
MNNKDEPITLTRNKSTVLMPGINIKAADNDTLRFYIYKLITEPGTYAMRGSVAGTVSGASNLDDGNSFTWNPQNFAGFFYDIRKDTGMENLKVVLSGDDGRKLSGDSPYGVTYTTNAQSRNFEFMDWGDYNVIAFLTDEYFSGYSRSGTSSDILNEANSTNLLESGQLTKVLIDDGQEKVIDLGSTIPLEEGYALKATLGVDKKGILVELYHNGKAIDREALILPGSYVYSSHVGNNTKVIPVIAAHFQEPIILDDKSYCKVDGLWQISQEPIAIKPDTIYGLMTIRTVDTNAGTITMANKNNGITLTKHKDAELMPSINITTADNDTLRFFPYRRVEIPTSGGIK